MLISWNMTLWLRDQRNDGRSLVQHVRKKYPKTFQETSNESIILLWQRIQELPATPVIVCIHRRLRTLVVTNGHALIRAYWWPLMARTSFIVLQVRRKEGPSVEVGIIWKPTKHKNKNLSGGSVGWHGGGHFQDKRRFECDAESYKTAKNFFERWCVGLYEPPPF